VIFIFGLVVSNGVQFYDQACFCKAGLTCFARCYADPALTRLLRYWWEVLTVIRQNIGVRILPPYLTVLLNMVVSKSNLSALQLLDRE